MLQETASATISVAEDYREVLGWVVVDSDVDTTEPLDGTSGEVGHGRLVGHIGGCGQGLAANRLTLPCQVLQGIGPAGGHHYPAPPARRTQARSPGRSRWRRR